MKPTSIGVLATAMFVAFTALLFWLQGGSLQSGPKKAYTHLHCPDCHLEMAYNAGLDGKTCPQCGGEGPKLVPTIGPSTGDDAVGEIGVPARLVAAGIVALVPTLGFVYCMSLRKRAKQKAALELQNRMMVCRCPFCRRRIGFKAKNQGTATQCPRCKTAFALAEGEERDDGRESFG